MNFMLKCLTQSVKHVQVEIVGSDNNIKQVKGSFSKLLFSNSFNIARNF